MSEGDTLELEDDKYGVSALDGRDNEDPAGRDLWGRHCGQR